MHAGGHRFDSDYLHQRMDQNAQRNLNVLIRSLTGDCTLKTEQWRRRARSKATEGNTRKGVKKIIVELGNKLQFERLISSVKLHNSSENQKNGQAVKSARGMPWHQEPKKDATSCDKLRGAAHTHRSGDLRMGKPGTAIPCQRALNQIGVRGERPELKHLSRGRKRHQPRFRQ